MYEITVETEFAAAHAIRIRGEREPTHGHNWRVEAAVRADALDDDGLVCDFHALEGALALILAPMRNNDLNRVPPFDVRNPTAELVARHIGDEAAKWLEKQAYGRGVRLDRVRVTEAPGCAAIYRPRARADESDGPR